MIVAAAVSLFLQLGGPTWTSNDPRQFAYLMLATVCITTVAWLAVTLITRPEPQEKLIEFYRRVPAAGPGWKPIAAAAGHVQPSESLIAQFGNWILGCVSIYASLFGIGKLIFKEWFDAGVCLGLALIAAIAISRNLARSDWTEGPA